MSSKIFVFDLETTGLGEMGEPIVPIQIAWSIIDPDLAGMPEVHSGQMFIKVPSYGHCEEYAMKMASDRGRTLEWLQVNGREPADAYRELDAIIRQFGNYLTPAGHNAAGFDMPILKREVKRHLGVKHKLPLDYHVMDTMSYALFVYKFSRKLVKNVKLRDLCAFLGIPFDENDAHDALYDVRKTADCLRAMVQADRQAADVASLPPAGQVALPLQVSGLASPTWPTGPSQPPIVAPAYNPPAPVQPGYVGYPPQV